MKKSKPWLNSYDQHVPSNLVYPNITILDLLANAVNKNKQKTWVIFKEAKITFEQMNMLIHQFATGLASIGVRKGDRIALAFTNTPEFLISYYATLTLGAIVVAINPFCKATELRTIIKDCRIRIGICGEVSINVFNEIFPESDLQILITSKISDISKLLSNPINENINAKKSTPKEKMRLSFSDLFLKLKNSANEFSVSENDPAIYQFTGGTTGVPKAAIGLHKNLVANTYQFEKWCDLDYGNEVVLAAIPLYHVYGMVLAMNLSLAAGSAIVLIEDARNVDEILKAIHKYKVTFFPGVPTMYHMLNNNSMVKSGKADLGTIKARISGSAPLLPEIKAEFEKYTGGKLIEGYGLSEAPTATHCNPLYGINKTSSIGLPLPDVDCKIVDLEDDSMEKEPGEIGELIIQGPQVMAGYFNNPDETKHTLKGGWLYTGDVGYMDNDGYFFLVDRKKSLIKIGGFQVWPNEIEQVLSSNSLIKEAGVAGVPDIEQGEKVIAWVVLEENQRLSEDDLYDWCESHLSAYKIPKEFVFLEAIPRTRVGKILRRELIRSYQGKNNTP